MTKANQRFLTPIFAVIAFCISCTAQGDTFEKLYDFERGIIHPSGGLVEHPNGKLYGVSADDGTFDAGSTFEIEPATGIWRRVASLDRTNGRGPTGVVVGLDNNLYGSASGGGSLDLGVVFKVTTEGVLSTVVSFEGKNGGNPYGTLTQDAEGNLFGTTSNGGEFNAPHPHL